MIRTALIVAGGKGLRMGSELPKQFLLVAAKPVLMHTLEAFHRYDEAMQLIVVLPREQQSYWKQLCSDYHFTLNHLIADGGETRFHSVQNGLMLVQEPGLVAVHDGVRPLVAERIITENIEKCRKYGYAITGMICKEAIMQKVDDCVKNIDIPRERLVRTQTPHTYPLGTLLKAHAEADAKGIDGTVASCTLMAELGVDNQHLVMGSEKNGLKLTQTEDVELFKALKHTTKDEWLK